MKSPKDVSQLQYITTTEDIAAMIDIVEVCGDAGDMPSVNAVQKILRRTINITCLTLVFSFDSMLHVLPTRTLLVISPILMSTRHIVPLHSFFFITPESQVSYWGLAMPQYVPSHTSHSYF
jgi:hypothetical protein